MIIKQYHTGEALSTIFILNAHSNQIKNPNVSPMVDTSVLTFGFFRAWQGQKDLNPRPTVLETAALPAELYPCILQELRNHACGRMFRIIIIIAKKPAIPALSLLTGLIVP